MCPSLCHYNAKLSKTADHLQRVSSSSTFGCTNGGAAAPVLPKPYDETCSYRKELWRTLAVAVLCLRVSVRVFMLNTL